MQWFRWYHGTCADPKLGSVARKTGTSRERVIAVWAMVLESASEADDRGSFAVDADGIADVLNCDTGSVAAILSEMGARGMLAEGRVVAFERRNFASDNSSERVRKHREKKAERPRNARETLQVAKRNAGVTPPDTETETEKDQHLAPAAVAASQPEAEPVSVRPARSGGTKKAPPKYPHYPAEAFQSLYAEWVERKGPFDPGRFRKETAPLFDRPEPRYPLEDLVGSLRLCLAVYKHEAKTTRYQGNWTGLTPGRWAGDVVRWVEDLRRTREDSGYWDVLMPSPAGRVA